MVNQNMSTVMSTSPNVARGQPTNLTGFNDEVYYDPFLPSSPSEEQLFPPPRNITPDSQSLHPFPIPAISNTLAAVNGTPNSPSNIYNQPQSQPHGSTTISGFHTSLTPQPDEYHNAANPYNLLSPNAPYLSDNGYNEPSDYTGTPDFNDDFCLETNFGLLADPPYNVVPGYSTDQLGLPQAKSLRNGAHKNHEPDYHHQRSQGEANLSSHLMSPILTDTASPGSRDGRASPTVGMKQIRHGFSEEVSSALQGNPQYPSKQDGCHDQMQHTPTLTGSSNNTTPERAARQGLRAASPVVRVESYSRGDSPDRLAGPVMRNGSKRSRGSRSSSHLAVQQDDSSSEGREEDNKSRPGSQSTVVLSGSKVDSDRDAALAEGRAGLDPQARMPLNNAEVPNFQDQEDSAQIAMKNLDVEDWLARSGASTQAGADDPLSSKPHKPTALSKRQRAKSTGDHHLSYANLATLPTSGTNLQPGPGLLLNEESGDEDADTDESDGTDSDDGSVPESPPADVGTNTFADTAKFSGAQDENMVQPPLYRPKVWEDPLYDSTDPRVIAQPCTSNQAIMQFQQRAQDIETLSRAATWGTRRLSDGDLQGPFHRFSFKHDNKSKDKDEKRGGFFEQAAAKLSLRRNGIGMRRKESENSKRENARPAVFDNMNSQQSFKNRHESLGIPVSAQETPSPGKRPSSPRIITNTSNTTTAKANPMYTLGASGPGSATAMPPSNPWTSAKNVIKRSRSRSDIQRPTSSTNLAELWTKQGGPPMPTLATPHQEDEPVPKFNQHRDPEEDEDEDIPEDKGVTIDLSIRADAIVTTLDGFKLNVQQLNPRLEPFLIDRIAQEQLRRYKKLIELKVKHAKAIRAGKCDSGTHCIELGGEPTYLPPKAGGGEPELSHTGFSIAGLGPSDDDANVLAEGIVTAAQFPPGVPMPPVKHLPAEFECSLCFKVKKFHKPSDWSKHVQEDVQPFTCTFAACVEPKSFKRKADWVRHENERHRQLEWWTCNMNDCSHKCYRKDNFVQHLVREHKLPEPKVKTAKSGKPAVRGPSSQKARTNKAQVDDVAQAENSPSEIDQVWRLVDKCRHETTKCPKDEPCKFCGNVCNSWKKLTVHLARHMEQISMPVLTVIRQRDVSPETIISPIENLPQQISMSPMAQSPFSLPGSSAPSYGMPTTNQPPSSYPPLQPTYSHVESTNPQSMAGHTRSQPSTYPPQVQPQDESSYFMGPRIPFSTPNYSIYNDPAPAPSQFVPVNAPRAFVSPKSPFSIFRNASISQSQRPQYALPGDASHYPSTYEPQPQPQQTYSGPNELSTFAYRAHPSTSYPQQASAVAPVLPMQYSPVPEMTYSSSPGQQSLFGQQQPQPQPPSPGQGYNYMHR